MSPDGKWIWDGAQWRPVAVHEAAFPNWQSVGAGFVPGADAAAPAFASPPAVQRQASPPAAYRMASPAPGIAAPTWGKGSRGLAAIQRYIPMAIGAAGLVVVIVIVSVVATLVLSNRGSGSSPAVNTAAGGPTQRSANAQATYVIKELDAPMSDLKDALTLVLQGCRVGMTSACEESLIAVEDKVSPMVTILDNATIPACIATPEAIVRADMGKIVEGEAIAVKGFNDNKNSEWLTGYAQVNAYGVRATNGYQVIKTAAASCDSTETGP